MNAVKVSVIIGRRVRRARTEASLTQRQLGEKVAEVLGRPWFPQAVSAAEQGARDWTAEDLVAVAWVLRRPVAWFFEVEDEDRAELLDVDGPALIHAHWAGGVDEEPSTEEIAAEIARLSRLLQKRVTVGMATSKETAGVIEPRKRRARVKTTARKGAEKR